MFVNDGSQLHFRCSFDLVAQPGLSVDWDDLVKTVRQWLTQRCGYQESLGGRWFYAGGDWKPAALPGFYVRTDSCPGTGTEQRPQHWAIRYRHPCADVPFRSWQTDIGLTALAPGRYRFTLTTTHALSPGYIGDEPPTPIPSAPGIVKDLVRSPRWTAFGGTEELATVAVPLDIGQGEEFVTRLEMIDRCPLILISLSFASRLPMLQPDELARAVAGAAVVYAATSTEVDRELEWLLPKHLRCWNGTVRVYQPGANRDFEPDGKRHRFFTAEDIDDRSPDAVAEIIIRGIVRRGRAGSDTSVTTVDDVLTKQRESRLAELRVKTVGQPSAEWVKLLEAENAALELSVKDLTSQRDQLDQEKETLVEQAGTLRYEIQALKAHLERVGSRRTVATEADVALADACRSALTGEPTLTEALTLIASLYPGRVVVLDSAWRSAEDAERFEEKGKAFRLMLTFAAEYWARLNAGEPNATAKQVFGEAYTGKESETVEHNSRARQLRTFEYLGRPVEMMSHLKVGVKPSVAKTWRLHFFWDADRKKLVVGHCGKHLDHG